MWTATKLDNLGLVGNKLVAHALHRLDIIIPDLLPQAPDVHIDGAVHNDDFLAPNRLKDPFPRDDLVLVGRELLMTALLLSAPAIIVSLTVGLVISVLQALTSIQEQTLNFAPRIVAVSLVLIATMPWTVKILMHFAERMIVLASKVGPVT